MMSARGAVLLLTLSALVVGAIAAARRAAAAPLLLSGDAPGGEWGGAIARAADDALAGVVAAIDGAGSLVQVADDALFQATGVSLMGASWLEAAERPGNVDLVAAMHAAEARYGIPFNLVVRLAWQESRFNPRAHNVGSNASGIMQIVPRWHPGVDPWEPFQAIDYGAGYLARLYQQFGAWDLALKAYNWGPGNVSRWIASGRVSPAEPSETREYSASILGDLSQAGYGVA